MLSSRVPCLALLALLALVPEAIATPRSPDVGPSDGKDIRRTELGPGIWQFTVWRDAYVRQLNTVAIETPDGVLVFDTQTRPSCARAIIGQIKQLTRKPVRWIVNSHWHPDHWTGNAAFHDAWPNARIIATAKAKETMETVSPAWPRLFPVQLDSTRAVLAREVSQGKQADGTPLTPAIREDDEDDARNLADFTAEELSVHRAFPDQTYSGTMTIRAGSREIKLIEVVGDAQGTTVLYMPKEKLLVTGDAVSFPIPYSSWLTTRHLATLRMLDSLDLKTIVPGHGPAMHDKTGIELEASLLQEIVDGVHKELAKGTLALAEVQAAVTCEDLRERFTHGDPDLDQRFRARVKVFVKFAVIEARDGAELPF